MALHRNLSTTGFLNVYGNQSRINAVFDLSLQPNERTLFQSINNNTISLVGVIPNGTATESAWIAYNAQDATNASYITIGSNDTHNYLDYGENGSSTPLPFVITQNEVPQLTIDASGVTIEDLTITGTLIGGAIPNQNPGTLTGRAQGAGIGAPGEIIVGTNLTLVGNTLTATGGSLPTFTANRVIVSDGSGDLATSAITVTTLNYLDATSSIQTQINSKADLSSLTTHTSDATIHFTKSSITPTDIGLGDVPNVDTTDATNITSGTLDDNRLSTNVTLQGNTFNNANELVQLDGLGRLPAVDGSQLTGIPGGGVTDHGALTGLGDDDHTQYALADGTRWTNTQAGDRVVISSPTGDLITSTTTVTTLGYLDVSSSIQTQLNNKIDDSEKGAPNGVATLDGSTMVPSVQISESSITQHEGAIDHNLLTNYDADEHIDWTVDQGATNIDDNNVPHTALTNNPHSVTATQVGLSNVPNVDATNAANITTGILPDARLSTNVTVQGNNFNNANELVQLNGTGQLPALDGSNITNVDHGNLMGLGDDDHNQYSLADGSRWTTSPTNNTVVISNGSGDLVSSAVTTTTLGYLDATSSIQTQLDDKATISSLSGHTSDGTIHFTKASISPSDIGLGNVDNTSDLNKPISTATQAGLDLKINLSEKGVANGVATLDGSGKVPASQLDIAALVYKGVWDALSNTPTLSNGGGGGVQGDYYVVSIAGTTLIDGNNSWAVGDWIINNGSTWDKVDNSDAVTSVAGKQGAVVLEAADITSGSFVDARIAQSNVTQHESAIDHDALTNYVANEHIDWTTDQGAINIDDNNLGHTSLTNNPHSVTALQVGLGNVDNTSDINKPISTATQNALNLKADVTSLTAHTSDATIHFTQSAINANNITTGSFVDGVITESSVTQHETAIDHDALANYVPNEHIDWTIDQGGTNIHDSNVVHTSLTNNPHSVTATQVGLGNVVNVDNTDASNIISGTLADARLSANVTTQGNTFNGNNQLVQLDASGRLPAVDGSQLTGISGAIDHGGLIGLLDDDHTQYSLADGTRWSVSQIPNRVVVSDGSGNIIPSTVTTTSLSFLDATSSIQTQLNLKANDVDLTSHVTDTTIHFTKTSITPTDIGLGNVPNVDCTNAGNITSGVLPNAQVSASSVTQHQGSIDHNMLTNYVAAEHIDWTNASSQGWLNQGANSTFMIHSDDINALSVRDSTATSIWFQVANNIPVVYIGAPLIYASLPVDKGVLMTDAVGNVSSMRHPMTDIHWQGNAAITNVTTTGVFVKANVASGTTLNPNGIGTWSLAAQENRLEYGGSFSGFAHIGATLVVDFPQGNDTIGAAIYKNGVFIPGSLVRFRGDGGGSFVASTAIHVMTNVEFGDYFEIWVTNYTETNEDPVVSEANLFIMIM